MAQWVASLGGEGARGASNPSDGRREGLDGGVTLGPGRWRPVAVPAEAEEPRSGRAAFISRTAGTSGGACGESQPGGVEVGGGDVQASCLLLHSLSWGG